ncbi:MAG: histidine kinase [Silvibacterium sp.]|nr:histidine kinase [Silvibacterium sp.]
MLAALFAFQEWVGARTWNYNLQFGKVYLLWAIHFLLWGAICWILWWKLRDYFQRATLKSILTCIVPLSIVLSILEEVIWVACTWHFRVGNRSWTFLHRLVYFVDSELVDNLLIFWVVFFLFRGVGYYQRLREKEFKEMRLESELTNAQLRALRMQLNPHFLFNTMNSISSLMHSDVELADRMLEQMCSMLRMTLDRGDARLIPLTDEIEFVQMYMAIQQMRFTGKVHSYVAIDPEVLDALVPTMILQPLMENAYVHGVAATRGEAFIGIEAQNHGGQLRICVRNSGRGLPINGDSGHEGRGVGIANVKARLELHYGNDQGFTLNEFPDGEVQAILLLPLGFSSRLTAKSQVNSYEDQDSHSRR